MVEGIFGRMLGRLQRYSVTSDRSKQVNATGKFDNGRPVQMDSAEEPRVQKHNSAASLPAHRTNRSQLSSVKTGEPRTRQRKDSIPDDSAAQAANSITIGKNRSVSVPDSAYQNEERMLLKHELETEDRDINAEISAVLMAGASHSERDLATTLKDNYDLILKDWQPVPSAEKSSAAKEADRAAAPRPLSEDKAAAFRAQVEDIIATMGPDEEFAREFDDLQKIFKEPDTAPVDPDLDAMVAEVLNHEIVRPVPSRRSDQMSPIEQANFDLDRLLADAETALNVSSKTGSKPAGTEAAKQDLDRLLKEVEAKVPKPRPLRRGQHPLRQTIAPGISPEQAGVRRRREITIKTPEK
jgi:hypothetical protein